MLRSYLNSTILAVLALSSVEWLLSRMLKYLADRIADRVAAVLDTHIERRLAEAHRSLDEHLARMDRKAAAHVLSTGRWRTDAPNGTTVSDFRRRTR